MSVKKCAPTATLLKDTITANAIKKYFNLGTAIENRRAKTNIVEAWPDGKEWKFESLVKKLKLVPASMFV